MAMLQNREVFQRFGLSLYSVMMKSNVPTVTVLTAVYNGEQHLREAIESILKQTFTDFEFIIVDDGSTDGTWDILNEYAGRDQRISLLQSRENVGLAQALNKGLALAKGNYIARQDGDDLSLPERLAIQFEYLERHKDVGLLGAAYYLIDSQGKLTHRNPQPETDTEIRWQMLFHNAFCHTSVMFRRDSLEEGSLFYDQTLPYSQDYEFWSRILRYTKGANLNRPLVGWRQNKKAISTVRREEQQRIAAEISANRINGLFNQRSISVGDAAMFRDWFYAFPKQLKKKDVQSCRQLIRILNAFGKQPEIDQAILSRIIARKMMGRMFFALNVSKNWDFHSAGLVADMFRLSVSVFFIQVINRAMHRMKRNHKAV